MLGDEFNDNREEHDSLIATQNGNTAQYNVSSIVSFKNHFINYYLLDGRIELIVFFDVELGGYSLYLGSFITGPASAARGRSKTAL